MKERFLHYIWQYQLFDKINLTSTIGEKIGIEKSGTYTNISGPDFINAQIKIGEQLWFGNVEIHLKSSDWYAHHHETDIAYDNVILHVVWDDDVPVFRKNNSQISTVELNGKVPNYLINNYKQLFGKQQRWIPCENNISQIDNFTWNYTLEKIYFERLIQKCDIIQTLLDRTKNDWETVLFIVLAKNFGLKQNGDAFFRMASALDYSVLKKIATDEKCIEAAFFGILNMLDPDSQNPYEKDLYKAYKLLKHKYKLIEIQENVHYYRLHPPNFPNIRLSQLAQLYFKNSHLLQKVVQTNDVNTFYSIFGVTTSDFWQTHYTFEKEHKKTIKKTTQSFIDLLLINTIIPLKFAYNKYIGNECNEELIQFMSDLKSEENTIVAGFKKINLDVKNALHSQALLTLKGNYCDKKRCMECEIGLKILNKE